MPNSAPIPSRPRSLVATDLDGTLLRSDGTVSTRTRACIARTGGDPETELVFVTGRPPVFLSGFADLTGHRGVAIAANGAVVLDLVSLTPTRVHELTQATVADVVGTLVEGSPEVEFRSMLVGRQGQYERIISVGADHANQVAEFARAGWRTVKMVALSPDPGHHPDDFLMTVEDRLTGLVEATHSSHRVAIVELGPLGITKGTTLAEHAEELGLPASAVHAVGDMPNDLPMLAWAGHSYGVANAHPRVLSTVAEVLPDNDSDGVAVLLERFQSQPG